MTVVAIHRGRAGTYNALVVDCVTTSLRENGGQWLEDKLVHVFGHTYATAIGDSLMLHALKLVVNRMDPRRPNLRTPEAFNAILGALERQMIINEIGLDHHPKPDSKGGVLFLCTRDDVFFWVAEFDHEAGRFRPATHVHQLAPGDVTVWWGSDPVQFHNQATPDGKPYPGMVHLIQRVDADFRSSGKLGLAYPLDDHFSGVTLPHKTSVPIDRLHPFRTLPEQLAHGCDLALLDDTTFMNYELPPGK